MSMTLPASARRAGFAMGMLMALSSAAPMPAVASGATLERKHAMSLIDAPKMQPGFKHFEWVNPNAPKGGRFRMYSPGTFDSFNQFAVQGVPTSAVALIYDSLFTSTPDEASTSYGSVAEWVSYPPDFTYATFGLRKEAKFHDGKPITVEDVIFSVDAIRKASPNYRSYWADVVAVEKTGEHEVTFRFKKAGNREMPHIVGDVPVLPKHFWEGKNAEGEQRDITRPLRETPLGSGPYKIKSMDMGRSVVVERVKDWWAADLPVNKGQWNFDEIHIVYFKERTAGFESFKRGDLDYWYENSAKGWATEYNFDAVTKGQIVLKKQPVKRVARAQVFVMNLRKKAFQDIRVRRAFQLAFDFEDANKKLFYDQYIRVGSFFDNSELGATGLPTGRELEILKEVQSSGAQGLPPEVFTKEWRNSTNNTDADRRANLSQAVKLLAEAGYKVQGNTLVNAQGEPLAVEFLFNSGSTWERIVAPFVESLKRIGVRATMRAVDTAQYQARKDKFDYDVIIDSFGMSESPGNEQRDYWGSKAAEIEGSRNSIGVRNPAVDMLVDKIIYAKDRAELVAATKALDRVLVWNDYVVFQWHLPYERFAIWNPYKHAERIPQRPNHFLTVVRTWWYDQAAGDKLKAEMR
ncbi:MAG: hypothetical protein RL291_585 [Pseudomonadota bacterium]